MRHEAEQLCSLVGYYTSAGATAKRQWVTGDCDSHRIRANMTAVARSTMSLARVHKVGFATAEQDGFPV